MPPSWKIGICAIFSILLRTWNVLALTGIRHLRANPDYRYVALNWEYELEAPHLYGFQVHYCELQAWGPHRCKVKTFENGSVNEALSKSRMSRVYSVLIPGLRMSTNYSFEVRPIANLREDREFHDPKNSQLVIVATKGFSAKASLCLPQESQIEVSTGPYFGGRIAVEAGDGERCVLDGDPNSPRDIYTLRINHETCGSQVNDTTVSTFVLVQENLPILTHSTRRFLVLCTYQPDTLTVRAKISLPSGSGRNRYQEEEHKDENRIDDDDRQGRMLRANLHDESGDKIRVSKLQQRNVQSADAKVDIVKGEPIAQFALMMTIVAVGIIGFIILMHWSIRRKQRQQSDEDSISTNSTVESTPSEMNFEIESVCDVETKQSCDQEATKSSSTDLNIARVHI